MEQEKLYCTNIECPLNKDNKCEHISKSQSENRQILCEEREL